MSSSKNSTSLLAGASRLEDYGACNDSSIHSQPNSMSRTGYVAGTPEYANFPVPHTADPSAALNLDSNPWENEQLSNAKAFGKASEVGTKRTVREYEEGGEENGKISTWQFVVLRVGEVVNDNTGLLLVVGSQMFLSMVNVAVKKLNSIDPPVSALELVWVRMSITYACATSYMLLRGVEHPFFGPPELRKLLVVRGFMGFIGLFGVYFSLQYLSLSDATVLTFLSPMCTAIAGALLLNETFTRREALAGVISLFGVVLIARPKAIFGQHKSDVPLIPGVETDGATMPQQRSLAVGIALIGVLGATGAYTTIRAIGKRAHPLHSLSYYAMCCVLFSTIGMIVTRTPVIVPTKAEWLAFLGLIGVLGFIAQVLLTMGLQREAAGRGSLAIYTQIVFATILQWVFFHTLPSLLSTIGTTLILGAGLWVVVTKQRTKKPQNGSAALRDVSSDSELERGLLQDQEDRTVDGVPSLEQKILDDDVKSRRDGPST